MRYVTFFLLISIFLSGCTESRATSESQNQSKETTKKVGKLVTKEVVVQTPLENGGLHIERTLVTDEVEDTGTDKTIKSGGIEVVRSGLDDSGKSVMNVVGAVSKAGTGIVGGNGLVEGGLALAITLAASWAANRHAAARQLKEERDFHKADADEGWKREPKA